MARADAVSGESLSVAGPLQLGHAGEGVES
jgi:hypothetical protein